MLLNRIKIKFGERNKYSATFKFSGIRVAAYYADGPAQIGQIPHPAKIVTATLRDHIGAALAWPLGRDACRIG